MLTGFSNKRGRGPIDPATGEPLGAREAQMNAMLSRTVPVSSSVPVKSISPEDISEFRRLGVNPGVRTTMQEDYDRLAYSQKTWEVWKRGVTGFVGKTAINTVGGIVGGFYGIGSAIAQGEMSAMWDNKFSNAMGSAEEWLDDELKIHMSSEVQEANFLQSLGASSFWARDVLGGLAFTAGAVLSELAIGAATGGIGTALRGTSITNKVKKAVDFGRKIFKIGKRTEDALSATSKIDDAMRVAAGATRRVNRINLAKDAALVARRTLTGAGYESGVEAIHFRKEAMDAWVQDYMDKNGGRVPTQQEYAAISDAVSSTGNAIYALNMATVGLSNFATLGSVFRKGLTTNQKLVGKSSSFYGREMPQLFGMNPLGKAVTASKTRTGERLFKSRYNGLLKGLGYSAAVVKNPLIEGMFEEGLQGSYNKTGLDYIQSMYNEDAMFNVYDLFSHIGEGLQQTYTTKEGWKEIGIGMLIGALGVPGRRWQGGIAGEVMDMRDRFGRASEIAKRLNESQTKVRTTAQHMAALQQATAEEDAAIEDGDVFRAKSAEDQKIFSTLAMRHETGFMQEFIEDYDEVLDNSTKEEFEELFNYENLTDEEFTKRKDKLKEQIRDRAEAVEKAYDVSLTMVTPTDMSQEGQKMIQRGAAFMAYNIQRYGQREEELSKEIQELVGQPLSEETLKNLYKLTKYGQQRTNWINNYYLPAIQAAENARDAAEVERLNKKKEDLENKIKADLKKDFNIDGKNVGGLSKKEYDRDVDNFVNQLNDYARVMNTIKEKVDNDAVVSEELSQKVKDLQRVGYERQSFIDQLKLLRTPAGMEAASNDVLEMMAKSERFGNTMMGMIAKLGGMQAIEEARKNNKTLSSRQLLKQLYANLGAQLGEEISITPEGETSVEQIKSLSKAMIGDPSELTNLKKQVIAILDSLTENRQNNITKLEQLQKFLEDFRESTEFLSIKSLRDTELINEYLDEVLNLISPSIEEQKEINAQEKQAKKEEQNRKGSRVFWRIKDLFKIVSKENKESLWEKVKNVPASELKNKITFRLVDATDTSIVNTSNPNVRIQKGINGKNILVFIEGEQVGGLTSPEQYIINDQQINFESIKAELESGDLKYTKSILRELNSDWVDLADPKEAAQILLELHNMHLGLAEKFEKSNEIPFPEDIIDAAEFASAGISTSLEYLEEKPSLSELPEELKKATLIKYTYKDKDGKEVTKENYVIIRMDRFKKIRAIYVANELDKSIQLNENSAEFNYLAAKFTMQVLKDNNSENIWRINTPYAFMTQAGDKFGVITAGLSSYKESLNLEKGMEELIINQYLPKIKQYFEDNKDVAVSDLTKDDKPEFEGNFYITVKGGKNMFINIRMNDKGQLFFSVKQTLAQDNYMTFDLNAFYDYESGTFRYYPISRSSKAWKNPNSTINQVVNYNKAVGQKTLKEYQDGLLEIYKEYKPSQSTAAIYGERLSSKLLFKLIKGEDFSLEKYIKLNENFKVDDNFEISRVVNNPQIEENEEGQFDLSILEPEATIHMAMFMVPNGSYMSDIKMFDLDVYTKRTAKDIETKQKKKEEPKEKPKTSDDINISAVKENKLFNDFIKNLKDTGVDKEKAYLNAEEAWKNTLKEENVENVDEAYEILREEVEAVIDEIYGEQEETLPPVNEELESFKDEFKSLEKKKADIKSKIDEVFKKAGDIDDITELEEELEELQEQAREVEAELDQVSDKIRSFKKPATKLSDLPVKDFLDVKLALKRLQRLIPNVPVEVLETISLNIKTKGYVQGALVDGVIQLAEKAEQGVEYHEAFHAVFRLLLSPEEMNRYLSFAKRHYGKAVTSEVTELMNIHSISRADATDLWYEEKMADDFQKYANKQKDRLPNLLQRLWERLLQWLGLVKTKEIESFFRSIYRGEFSHRESKYSNKRGTPTSLLKAASSLRGDEIVTKYLPTSISNAVVSTLATRLTDIKDITSPKVAFALEQFKKDVNRFGLKNMKFFEGEEAEMIKNRINDIVSALSYTSNIDEITSMVRDKVSFINTYEEDDAGSEEDSQKESWQQDPSEIGGYKSASKRLKHYLSLVTGPRNIFGVSKKSWENFLAVNDDVNLKLSVDEKTLYNNLIKMLTSVPKYRMLDQLTVMKDVDTDVRLFVDKMLVDIGRDLNMTPQEVENLSSKLPLGEYLALLETSNTYNFITSSLRKDRVMHYDINYDVTSNKPKMFNANSKTAGNVQVELWDAETSAMISNIPEDEMRKRIENFYDPTPDNLLNRDRIAEKALMTFKETGSIDSLVDEIQERWASVGINFERNYVKYSIIEVLINQTKDTKTAYNRLLSDANRNKLDETYTRWYEKHQNIQGIYEDADVLSNIKEGAIKALQHDQYNLFSNISRKTVEGSAQFGESITSLGVRSSIRPLARANALFNPIIIPSVFQNQEGKNQYDIIESNFQTEMMSYFTDKTNLNFIKEIVQSNKSPETFAAELIRNNAFPGLFSSKEKALRWVTAVKYNPLLQDNIDYLLSPEFAWSIFGGIKTAEYDNGFMKKYGEEYKKGGVTWKHATPADRMIMTLSMFDTTEGAQTSVTYDNNEYVFYRVGVPSDASMVPVIRMVKRNLVKKGNLTSEAVESINQIAQQEHARILNTQFEIQDIIESNKKSNISENYHYVIDNGRKILYNGEAYFIMDNNGSITKDETIKNTIENFNKYAPRGLKFFNLASIENADQYAFDIVSGKDVDDANLVNDAVNFLNSQFDEFVNMLASEEYGIISKLDLQEAKNRLKRYQSKSTLGEFFRKKIKEYEGYVQRLEKGETLYLSDSIPSGFKNDTGIDVNFTTLKNFFFNDYINSYAYFNLMFGDNAFVAKNSTDWVKRLKGANAAGNDYGNGKTRYITVKDGDFNFESDHMLAGGKVTRADGQTRATVSWFKNTIISSEGNLTREVRKILEKIEMGYVISKRESDILKDNQAETQPSKSVAFDVNTYIKTSIAPILRSEVSYFVGNRKEVDKLYQEIFDEKRKINPDEEFIRNNYIKIHQSWEAIPGSEYLHKSLNLLERESIDLLVYDSASKRNLEDVANITEEGDIYNYFDENENGIVNTHDISNKFVRNQVKTHGFKNQIVDGTQKMGLIWSEQIQDAVLYFLGEKTNPKEAGKQYEKLMADRVRMGLDILKKTLLDGDKAQYKVLMSSFKASAEAANMPPNLLSYFDTNALGKPIHDINNPSIEPKIQAMFLAFASNQVLKHKADGHKFSLISDHGYALFRDKSGNVITRKHIKNMLESGQEINYTQDRLRMKDNQIEVIVSERFLFEHGLSINDAIPDELLKMHGVRIPTQDKHSMGIFKIVDVMPANMGNGIIVPPEVTFLAGSDFDIDALYARIRGSYRDKNNKLRIYGDYRKEKDLNKALDLAYEEYIEDAKSNKKFKSLRTLIENEDKEAFNGIEISKVKKLRLEIKKAKEKKSALRKELKSSDFEAKLQKLKDKYDGIEETNKDEIASLNAEIKKLSGQIKEINEIYTNITLDVLGYLNQDAFEKAFKQQVKDNIKAKYPEPITVSEANNYLIELEEILTINEGNIKEATTPADRELFVNLQRKLYSEEFGLVDPTVTKGAHDILSKAQSDAATSIGQQNIGIAAVNNMMVQQLVKHKMKIQDGVNREGEPIDRSIFGRRDFTLTDDNNNRVNNAISTFITAMTDNQKFNDAGRFNLSTDTLNFALLLTSLGMPFDLVGMIVLSKPIKDIYNKLLSKKRLINKNEISKRGLIEEVINGIPGDAVAAEEINEAVMEEVIKYENGKESTLSEQEYNGVIKRIAIEFLKAENINNYLFNASRLLQLNKGVSKDFASAEEFIKHMKETGYEYIDGKIVKTDDKIGPISNMDEYLNSDYNYTNIDALHQILDISGKFLLMQTKFAKQAISYVKEITNDDAEPTIRKQFIVHTISQVIRNKYPDFSSLTIYDLLTKEESSELQMDIEKARNRNPNNRLLKFLANAYRNYQSDQYQNRQFYGYTLTLIKGGVRNIKDPAYLASLADGFNDLMASENPADNQLAKNLIGYLFVKDGFLYNNDTFVQHINPNYLLEASESGKEALLAFNDEIDFKSVFGISKAKFQRDFTEMFSRYIANSEYFPYYYHKSRQTIEEEIAELQGQVNEEIEVVDKDVENYNKLKASRFKKLRSPILFLKSKDKEGNWNLDITEENGEEITKIQVNPFGDGGVNARPKFQWIQKNFNLYRKVNGVYYYSDYGRIAFRKKNFTTNKNLIATSYTAKYTYEGDTYFIEHAPNGKIQKVTKQLATGYKDVNLDFKNVRDNEELRAQYNDKKIPGGFQATQATYSIRKYISSYDILPYPSGMDFFENFQHTAVSKKADNISFGSKNLFKPDTSTPTEISEGVDRPTEIPTDIDAFIKEHDFRANSFYIRTLIATALEKAGDSINNYDEKSVVHTINIWAKNLRNANLLLLNPIKEILGKEINEEFKFEEEKLMKILEKKMIPDAKSGNLIREFESRQSDDQVITIEKAEVILNQLSKKFGINWKWDENINALGMFNKGEVLINPNRFRQDTLFHEFAHPFLIVIKKTNPLLYKTLSQEIENSDILKQVERVYPDFSPEEQIDEAIVTAIGLDASNMLNEPKLVRLIKLLLRRIAQAISEAFGINIKQLPENMTINDIAMLMVSDVSIDLLPQNIDGFEEIC